MVRFVETLIAPGMAADQDQIDHGFVADFAQTALFA
jgi:hypothetical protein